MFDGWKVVENSAKRVEEGGAAGCIFGLQNGVLGCLAACGSEWTNFCGE